MKKLLQLCALGALVFGSLDAACCDSDYYQSEPVDQGERGQRGSRGHRGQRGRRGERGRRGAEGPAGPTFEIGNFIEATNTVDALLGAGSYIPLLSPIIYPLNGITSANGLALVESVPLSGNFDTITLPAETADTFYLVSYGVSLGLESFVTFELELNGTNLPYTSLGNSNQFIMASQTSIIRNPAGVAGTLRIVGLTTAGSFNIAPPTEGSSSVFITVLKLNNNTP